MLVLTRKKGEQIVLNGGQIVLTVCEIRGDKVRIGLEAPPEVIIYRKEVWDAINLETVNVEDGNGTEVEGN